MTDRLLKSQRSENMRRICSKNTKPELIVRRLLYSMGYRFKSNDNSLPGKPDITIKKHKIAVFIHGCFWHQHKKCNEGRIPKTKINYWKPKLEANVKRDKQNASALKKQGWKVLKLWECEIQNENAAKDKVVKFMNSSVVYKSIEICTGAGGQALGLEQAGFEHTALVEIEPIACDTLRKNRPQWNVVQGDVKSFQADKHRGIDLLAGGIPCPPFSIAGKQLGAKDERDLFPEVIRLTLECNPKVVMIENVKGLLSDKFAPYRVFIEDEFNKMGYKCNWKLLNASDFGVPQLRPRVVFVALKDEFAQYFKWPEGKKNGKTVGQSLLDLMKSNGWEKAEKWAGNANAIAPTLVGGSKKHGGPDLGPTRSREAWALLDVDGSGLANQPPNKEFIGKPKLTVEMTAILQGFPISWKIAGSKTASYRQIGNAFPPPVAKEVGISILKALKKEV
ncbi:DNA mismatch endonuclease Vsr [candidate division TA06 bacterium]|nr:DNA mismatch endonuclease Vsr [candidate division TA06 bacterium]